MDDSDASSITSCSSSDGENVKIVPVSSRRAQFFEIYERQQFSLPDSIMFYVAKNPTSPKLYDKMIQTCKDFFVKNPIIVLFDLNYCTDDLWFINFYQNPLDITTFTCKFWITNELEVICEDVINEKAVNQNPFSSLIPKLHRCDAKDLVFENLIISFADFLLLIPSAEDIRFCNITVKDDNGASVALEKIVEVAVKAKEIRFHPPAVTSKTMKELIKIPHFTELSEMHMYEIPEAFDLETFFGYMKKNQDTDFWLTFNDSLSEAYKNRLVKIVDEVLATKVFDYKPPFIAFDGLDDQKSDKLSDIYFSH